ncbi:peptidoglycan DD-metalloendopeptidase family protein [Sphaerisporangium sp. B11E5]|uniref:peptidoglycan DD-metalloendopeptidase family protein n=1 Tax=Sphaerisporangium sp. B11E5 TaxID=3153563 RepID=UPI00325D7B6E
MAAIAAAVLVTAASAACAAPGGVAGISTLPPAPTAPTPDLTADPGVSPSGLGASPDASGPTGSAVPEPAQDEIDPASLEPAASPSVTLPKGDAPVRVPPPRLSPFKYVFPVRGCRVDYPRQAAAVPKSTIWAGKGCAFVAPVDGVVHETNVRNRWTATTDRGADRVGRFVSIIGRDGVRYLGGHLDSVQNGIRPGVPVRAGQLLGTVGDSGDAKGASANLYFAISWQTSSAYWWIRRGMVDPWSYLDAWMTGNPTLSPRTEVASLRARLGATPRCQTDCTAKPNRKPRPTPSPTRIPTPQVTIG